MGAWGTVAGKVPEYSRLLHSFASKSSLYTKLPVASPLKSCIPPKKYKHPWKCKQVRGGLLFLGAIPVESKMLEVRESGLYSITWYLKSEFSGILSK